MLGLALIVLCVAICSFLYMGGMRGRRLALTAGGTIFAAFVIIGSLVPKQEQKVASCAAGYVPDATGQSQCTATCEVFKQRAPRNDEARYYAYCQEHASEALRIGMGIGQEEWKRAMRNMQESINEAADRERGLSERDVTLRKIERHLRDR